MTARRIPQARADIASSPSRLTPLILLLAAALLALHGLFAAVASSALLGWIGLDAIATLRGG